MIDNLPAYAWALGGALGVAGLKFFWPMFKAAFGAQTGQWRTESGFLKQMSDELDRALARADAADARATRNHDARESAERRADKYFTELADSKTQVQLLTLQLQMAREELIGLGAESGESTGDDDA